MIHTISAQSALQAWKDSLQYVKKHGDVFEDREKKTCIECQNLTIFVEDGKKIDEPVRVLSRNDEWLYPDLYDVSQIMLPHFQNVLYQFSYGKRLFSYRDVVNQ
ncbi:MAG: hypothetical protein ACMXYA_02570, partial [Candidatus Woesearchaeota archaeon]